MYEIFQKRIKEVNLDIDEIVKVITPMIDKFWGDANAMNRSIIDAHHGDKGKMITSRYFPMIDHIGSAKKKTIGWHDVAPKYKGPRKNFYTKTVAPTAKGFTTSCFPKALSWEKEMILEFEMEILPYREAMVALHEHKIFISRLIRKHSLDIKR